MRKIKYKSIEKMIEQSKHKIAPVRTHRIEPIDYNAKLERIINSKQAKLDTKRFYDRCKANLYASFYGLDKYSRSNRLKKTIGKMKQLF